MITTEFYTLICDSVGRKVFIGVLYGYKSILQVLAHSYVLFISEQHIHMEQLFCWGINCTRRVTFFVHN